MPAPFFADASDLLADGEPMRAYGACGFDADGDGRDELFVCGFGDANRLLKWDGRQVIDLCREDPAFAPLADPERLAIGCCAADIDGDGREELYVLTSDVFAGAKRFSDRLFTFDNGEWRDLFVDFEHAAVMNLVAGRSVAAIDRHGQGRYGFLLATYGGPSVLYEMDRHGRLYDMAETAGLRFETGGRSLVVGPLFNGGSRPDVFCGNEGGGNFAFVNKGDGTFTEAGGAMGLADAGQHARGVVAIDAGAMGAASGRFALVIANWEGPGRLLVPRGSTTQGWPTFANVAPRLLNRPMRARTTLACDFDHDGRDEIIVHNMGHANVGFRVHAHGLEPLDLGPATEETGLGTGGAWCDLDGDGVAELLLCHGEAGRQPLTLFKPRDVKGPATVVRPRLASGAPARHAMVIAEVSSPHEAESAGPSIRVGLADAGSGYLCQMPPVVRVAHGAGEAKAIFPSGRESRATMSDGELTIDEPSRS